MIKMIALKARFLNVLIAIDQLAWVLLTLGRDQSEFIVRVKDY